MKNTIGNSVIILALLFFQLTGWSQKLSNQKQMDVFITNLLKKMTIEEKLGQMNLVTPSSKTGPFATKNALSKLKDGSGGNVYAIMGTPAFVHSRAVLADSTRLKIMLLPFFKQNIQLN